LVDPEILGIVKLSIAARSVATPPESTGGNKTTKKNGMHQITSDVIADTETQNIDKDYWQKKQQSMQLCRQKKKLRGI